MDSTLSVMKSSVSSVESSGKSIFFSMFILMSLRFSVASCIFDLIGYN